MEKYAEWIESEERGYNQIIYRHVKRKILDEKDNMYLVEDPEHGEVWINKRGVKFVKYETNKA